MYTTSNYGPTSRTMRPMNARERQLNALWVERLNRYLAGDKSAMPEQVIGIGTIARTGAAGHSEGDYPIIQGLDGASDEVVEAALADLPEDVRFAATWAQLIVDDHNQHAGGMRGGLGAFVTDVWSGGRARQMEEGGEPIARLNFSSHARIVLPIGLSGGAA